LPNVTQFHMKFSQDFLLLSVDHVIVDCFRCFLYYCRARTSVSSPRSTWRISHVNKTAALKAMSKIEGNTNVTVLQSRV